MKTVMNLIFNGASNKKFLRDFLNHLTPRENSKLSFLMAINFFMY